MADFDRKFEDLEKGEKFPIGEPHKLVIPKVLPRVRIIGFFFDLNKCFLLPTAMAGMKGIRKQFLKHPNSNMLVVGHTDTSGDNAPNLTLSLERADSVVAYFKDDIEAWDKFFDAKLDATKRWGNREVQLMLSQLPDKSPIGKRFFKGEATGGNDATVEAVAKFQTAEKISPADGKLDPVTRKKIIDRYMELDGPDLPTPATGTISLTGHGAGENFPEIDTGDGVRKDENRRVEIFFFDGPITPPPPKDRLSRKGSPEYPLWKKQVTEDIDFHAGTEGPQARLTINLMKDATTPLADRAFRLEIGDAVTEGTTDADGLIDAEVSAGAGGGFLFILGKAADGSDVDLWSVELEFADLPAAATLKGAQQRLNNLGLFAGREDGKADPVTERALRRFQALAGISPETGKLDAATAQKLEQTYGS
jgi:peptidoglycan hydrolase-like protein with peptidoglycan-binding domain